MTAQRLSSSGLMADGLRFSAVGAASWVIDVATFNVLRITGHGALSGPLLDKTAGVVLATVFAWVGSRYWTFKRDLRPDPGRELIEFSIVAAIGYAVNAFVLYLSHYVFGFRSLLADNLAANVVGALLATVLRFVLYRFVVYRPGRSRSLEEREHAHSHPGR